MDRQRTRSTLTLCFILTIYLLNSRNPRSTHPSNTQTKTTPIERYKEDFEGYDPDFYITLHYDQTAFHKFRLKKYSERWKSDPQCFVFASPNKPLLNRTVFFNESSSFIIYRQTCFPKCSSLNYNLTYSGNFDKIEGQLSCNDSVLSFSLSKINKDLVYKERLIYGLLISLTYILILSGIMKHYKECLESNAFAVQTSVFTLAMIMLYEMTFSLWQIKKAFEEDVTSGIEYFLISVFWGFLIFMVVYSKVLVTVFQANEPGTFRLRAISNYQSRVFLIVLIVMLLMNFFSNLYYVWLVFLQMPFIPQIIQNSVYGYKKSFSMTTVILYLLSRAIISAYFLLYDPNIIKYKPSLPLLSVVFFVLFAQLAVLYWQRFKPRFLVPKQYRPLHYDYFRSKNEEELIKDQENTCNICMTHLNIGNHPETVNFAKTMHAPCSHRYHQDCLLQWMQVKLECPTCRSKLPAFEDF